MKYFCTCLTMILLTACSGKDATNEKEKNNDGPDQIYPVSLFFQEQIHEVDSLKLPTVKYSVTNLRKDTAAISMEEFKALAKEFVDSDITQPAIRKHYKETSFADQSIPSITLNYSTDNKDLAIQRVDVILDPNPVTDDKVKTIYIEKKETLRDTVVIKKLYWKAGKNFQVITSKKVGGQPENISQLKVAWDDSDQF